MTLARASLLAALVAMICTVHGAAAQSLPGEAALGADQTGTIVFHTGSPGRQTLAISGSLALPAGDGRVPAMVVMHGSSGTFASREARVGRLLNQAGIAAFFVDSFTARGITSTVDDQSRLSYTANTEDAFNALRMLRGHPRIDPGRIGVMGFSRGGIVTRLAAMASQFQGFRQQGLQFAAYVAFYPGCNLAPLGPTVGGPMLMLLGGRDEWTPAGPCVAYASHLRMLGSDVRDVVYPDGRHAWDAGGPPGTVWTAPNAVSLAACPTIFTLGEGGIDAATGRPLSSEEIRATTRGCVRRGPVPFGPDAATRAQSDRAVLEFLRPIFGL